MWEQHYFAEAFCAALVAAVESALASSSLPGGVATATLQSLALLEAAGASTAAANVAVRLMASVLDAGARACAAPVDAVVLTAVGGRQAELAASGQLVAALGVLSRAGWQLQSPPYSGTSSGGSCALAVEMVSRFRCCCLNPQPFLCNFQSCQAKLPQGDTSYFSSSAQCACC